MRSSALLVSYIVLKQDAGERNTGRRGLNLIQSPASCFHYMPRELTGCVLVRFVRCWYIVSSFNTGRRRTQHRTQEIESPRFGLLVLSFGLLVSVSSFRSPRFGLLVPSFRSPDGPISDGPN